MIKEKVNHYIGIDLGTTNSVIAFGKRDKTGKKIIANTIKIKALNENNNLTTMELLSSCVYFKENDSPVIGKAAKGKISTQSSRVVKSVKSKMGEEHIIEFDKKVYTPEDVSALILQFMAKKAEEVLKTLPDDVIITVPASFNSDQRIATIKAAEKAGFKIRDKQGNIKNILLDEPRAALFDFVESYNRSEISETTLDLSTSKNILVYDLGGGTLDVSLHKINYEEEEDKINIEDYAISRYTQIGGDSFDYLLANYFRKELESKGLKYEMMSDFEKNRIDMQLMDLAENTKLELSSEIINALDYGNADEEELKETENQVMRSNIWDNRGIDMYITLEKYEEIISELLGKELSYSSYKEIDKIDFSSNNNIIFPILDVISKAEKKIGKEIKIDAILLNGGMTKFYSVKKRLEDFFGMRLLTVGDEDKSVAKGAVYYHYSLHRGIKYNKIQNESIGIETEGNFVKCLVPSGVILPYKSEIFNKFEVPEEGATSLILPFYLGERQDTKEPNKKIAKRRVEFEKSLAKGTPISLQVEVNESGIMSVKGWLENDDKKQFLVSIETDKIEITNAELCSKVKSYQKIKKIENKNEKNGPEIDINQMKEKFERLFQDKYFNQEEYKNMYNRIKIARNGSEIGEYLIEKIRGVSKENRCKIINILGEIGKDSSNLCKKIISECINLTLEKKIVLFTDTKEVNRIIKDCVITMGKLGNGFVESHLLYLLGLPYTITIEEDIITSIGKVGYSKNALKHLEKNLKNTDSEKIGKMIRLIWSIGKVGSREKENAIESPALIESINIIKRILEKEKHKELVEKCIYALGELCDSRFGKEIEEEVSNEIIIFLENIFLQKGSKQQKLISLILNMIRGKMLTKEEEESLLSIRSSI